MSISSIEETSNIKKSLKVTSLFGGVQVLSILISIIRNKCIALLIGPVGVGFVELYNSTIRLIGTFTDFSIRVSAVRDVSVAYKSGNQQEFNRIAKVFSKLVWFTGLLGTIVCLLGAPLWSKFSFNDYSHTWQFAILSGILLLNQLQNGKSVILQGTENYRYLAYSGVIGNIVGLFTTLPIYYIWGVDGVIPVLLLTALTSFILTYYFARKIDINDFPMLNKEAMIEGKKMLKQGFLLSVNYIYSALLFYILRIFITNQGGVEELGLYSAGFMIVSTYVGLVFQSLSQEYYPRLSSLSLDIEKMRNAINDQIYFSILVLGPLIALFMTCSDFLLQLLYSSRFSGASLFMAVSMLGVLFQAPSFCMVYALLAKGDNRDYLIYETVSKTIKLFFDVGLYLMWGLTGLGIAFVISYIYYTIQSSYVCKKKYGYTMSKANILNLAVYICVCLFSLCSFILLPLVIILFFLRIINLLKK